MSWIYLDKPCGVRSIKSLTIVKKAAHLKKAGVAGILDEFACGLLPIAIDSSTKLIDEESKRGKKEYIFTIKWGSNTNTGDYTGVFQPEENYSIRKEDILLLLPKFTGWVEQIPPVFSNIKVNGIRSHQLARKNIEVVLPPRLVYIDTIELLSHGTYTSSFICLVSTGTYIRSLGRDIGLALNVPCHLSYLRRSAWKFPEKIIYPEISLQYYLDILDKRSNL